MLIEPYLLRCITFQTINKHDTHISEDHPGDLEDSKSTSGGTSCIFGSHAFVPISWMWKKQTAVPHSSTESEIISLDRTEIGRDPRSHSLEFGEWNISFRTKQDWTAQGELQWKPLEATKTNMHNFIQFKHTHVIPTDIDRAGALYVFEDSEAVIKMIIKGRSHTMRHVSRTHRVALDWLFHRIGPKYSHPLHRHQTPTRIHVDHREFYKWWVEQSSSLVQH